MSLFTIKTIINVSKYDKKLLWRIENHFYSARLNMIPDKPAFFLMYVLTHGKPDSRQVKQSFKCNKSSIPCGVKLAKYSPSVQNVCFCQNKQNVSKYRQTNDDLIQIQFKFNSISIPNSNSPAFFIRFQNFPKVNKQMKKLSLSHLM